MRNILVTTGYYDAQWRKYEAGGSLNIASLMKVALALDVTLVDLLDGLGQWPKLSVDEIEKQYGIEPLKASGDPEQESEPGTPVRSRRKARSTTNAVTLKATAATSSKAQTPQTKTKPKAKKLKA